MKVKMLTTIDTPQYIWRRDQELDLDEGTADKLIMDGFAVAVVEVKEKKKRGRPKKEQATVQPEVETAIEEKSEPTYTWLDRTGDD